MLKKDSVKMIECFAMILLILSNFYLVVRLDYLANNFSTNGLYLLYSIDASDYKNVLYSFSLLPCYCIWGISIGIFILCQLKNSNGKTTKVLKIISWIGVVFGNIYFLDHIFRDRFYIQSISTYVKNPLSVKGFYVLVSNADNTLDKISLFPYMLFVFSSILCYLCVKKHRVN